MSYQMQIPVLSWGESIYDTKFNLSQRFAAEFLDKKEKDDYLGSAGKKRFITEKALIKASKAGIPHVYEMETTKTLHHNKYFNYVKALLDYLNDELKIAGCSVLYWRESRCMFHFDVDVLCTIMKGYILACETIGKHPDDFDQNMFLSLYRYRNEEQLYYDITKNQLIPPVADAEQQLKILKKVSDLKTIWNKYNEFITRTSQ